MSKIIELFPQNETESVISQRFKIILEQRKKQAKEPLTPDKLRKRLGLENISDEEAIQTIQTIKDLASLFFEIACLKEPICIDNQHVVSLNQQKKAA
jgi:hypothetical protein